MSATIKGFAVTLETDVREESAEEIRKAILQLNHVIGCEACEESFSDVVTRNQVRHELGEKLIQVVYPRYQTARESNPKSG